MSIKHQQNNTKSPNPALQLPDISIKQPGPVRGLLLWMLPLCFASRWSALQSESKWCLKHISPVQWIHTDSHTIRLQGGSPSCLVYALCAFHRFRIRILSSWKADNSIVIPCHITVTSEWLGNCCFRPHLYTNMPWFWLQGCKNKSCCCACDISRDKHSNWSNEWCGLPLRWIAALLNLFRWVAHLRDDKLPSLTNMD
jgi:hypothetical protein